MGKKLKSLQKSKKLNQQSKKKTIFPNWKDDLTAEPNLKTASILNLTKMIVLHLRPRLSLFLEMGKSCPRSLQRPRKLLQRGHERKNPVTPPDRHPKVQDQAVLENPSNTRMILLLKVLRKMILLEVNQ